MKPTTTLEITFNLFIFYVSVSMFCFVDKNSNSKNPDSNQLKRKKHGIRINLEKQTAHIQNDRLTKPQNATNPLN